jgi:dUTP pyrophosphatase
MNLRKLFKQWLPVRRLETDAKLPLRAHADDAGLDLTSLETLFIEPKEHVMLGVGVACAIPDGSVGLVLGRSSLNKKGVLCHAGVIDAGYRGELKVVLHNLSRETVRISQGDRIAQLVLVPLTLVAVTEVTSFQSITTRAGNGFGSTGA